VIEHDQKYTSFVFLTLLHTPGGKEGGTYSRGGAYFKFWLDWKDAYSKGAAIGGEAVIQGFTVAVSTPTN